MKLNRKEFLHKLLCVEPGVNKQETTIPQTSCIVMRRGRFYSYSQEIACSTLSGLDVEIDGAIRAEKLIAMLEQLPDEEITVVLENNVFKVSTATKHRAKFAMEEEVLLPVDEVERPKDWVLLHEDFTEAVDLVHRCTRKKDVLAKECVHINKDWLESSDDVRMIRYTVPTFVKDSILVRGEAIKKMVPLGMTKGCETANWLHFRNPMGLRMSIRKFEMEEYPPLGDFLKMRGTKVVLPKGLEQVSSMAGLFVEEDGNIHVSIKAGELTVQGISVEGEYGHTRKSKYEGPDLDFLVPPKLIAELVHKHTQCEVTSSTLRVNGGKYIYATALEMKV